jgi:hypothetical protein
VPSLAVTLVSSKSLLQIPEMARFLWAVLKRINGNGCKELSVRLTGQVCVVESVSVVSCLMVRSVRRANLAVGGIATRLKELKYLFRPGTAARARGQRRSESLNSVGLPRRQETSVVPTGLGRREVHLKTGVAQWWN